MRRINMDFGKREQLILGLKKEGENKLAQADVQLKALQADLRSRKIHSENPLSDFLFAWYGLEGRKVEDNYAELRDKLTGKINSPVLVYTQVASEGDLFREVCLRGGLIPLPRNYKINLTLKLGKIAYGQDLEFDIFTGDLGIRTKNYVGAEPNLIGFDPNKFILSNINWAKKEGNIKVQYGDLPHLHKKLLGGAPYSFTMIDTVRSGVLVGDEVEKYFGERSGKETYAKALEMLK